MSLKGLPMDNEHQFNLYDNFARVNSIDPKWYREYDVKRGLRNADGSGVIAGVTNISNVHGYVMSDGDKRPDEGRLTLRGYDIYDLIGNDGPDRRFNFEEVAYLLLTGDLPTRSQLRGGYRRMARPARWLHRVYHHEANSAAHHERPAAQRALALRLRRACRRPLLRA